MIQLNDHLMHFTIHSHSACSASMIKLTCSQTGMQPKFWTAQAHTGIETNGAWDETTECSCESLLNRANHSWANTKYRVPFLLLVQNLCCSLNIWASFVFRKLTRSRHGDSAALSGHSSPRLVVYSQRLCRKLWELKRNGKGGGVGGAG